MIIFMIGLEKMKIKKRHDNILHVTFPTQQELASTFLRFQEYYESPNPMFKRKIFTLGEYRIWYAEEYGAFTYYDDWNGFNIPSDILAPFIEGRFDPLSEQEQALVDALRNKRGRYYIIGTVEKDWDTFRHEMCHALYTTWTSYEIEVNKILDQYDLVPLEDWLRKQGYDDSVLLDECNAYIVGDWHWLEDQDGIQLDITLYTQLVALYKGYTS